MWQRAHMFGGWTPYQLGIETEEKKTEKKPRKKKTSKEILEARRERFLKKNK